MKGRHHRVFRVLALALTAAAVVVPVTGAAGSSDGSARPKSGGHVNVHLSAMTALIGAEDVVAFGNRTGQLDEVAGRLAPPRLQCPTEP